MTKQRVAIIGGGWAGLAAGVKATQLGHHVSLFEMAPSLGGRARQIDHPGQALDNGQHLLIGAYRQTLELMAQVGVDLHGVLWRRPLSIVYPDGKGLQLKPGQPIIAFFKAVLSYQGWSWSEKIALLKTTTTWGLKQFTCSPEWTVQTLLQKLPAKVCRELLDPLCVAALNTPASQASASVFLRVLKDALFSGPGSCDLLLPRQPLSQLWPQPAKVWLEQQGATIQCHHRVQQLRAHTQSWAVDDILFDSVIVACGATQAAALVQNLAPQWAAMARSLHYEPIITVYAHSPHVVLPQPMLTLQDSPKAPAQYVFDLGPINGHVDLLAFVVSGASAWVEQGQKATEKAVLEQGRLALSAYLKGPLSVVRTITEKRATFLCTPQLQRPTALIAPGLIAAGDYIAGPYPATLEGAMRCGVFAAQSITP
jgi:hydroxysqualene dehydroxylase